MPKIEPGSELFDAVGAQITAEMPETTTGIVRSSFSLSEWSRASSFASDDAMRVLLGQLARTRGIPDTAGQFAAAASLLKRPLPLRSFNVGSFTVDPSNLSDVQSFLGGTLQDGLADAVGAELGKLAGSVVGDVVGGVAGAVPVVGGIVSGFYDVIRGMVAYRAKVPEYENAFPEVSRSQDRAKADAAIELARSRPDGDWGGLFSPPGRASDAHWAAGMGELDLPGKYWAVGKVAWDPQDYGKGVLGDDWLAGRSWGGVPRLGAHDEITTTVHLGAVTSAETGAAAFDPGRFLPVTAQALGHLFSLLRNPASPLIFTVNPTRLAERWLRYMAAMRIALHSTHAGGTDRAAPMRHILVKWRDLDAGSTIPEVSGVRMQARADACNMLREVFGWPEWTPELDEQLVGNPIGIDAVVDRFRLRETPVFKAWEDLYQRQRYAAKCCTVAYTSGGETALAQSEIRRLREDTLRDLTSSKAALYVDRDLVDDPELGRALRAVQLGGRPETQLHVTGEAAARRAGATLRDLEVKGDTLPPRSPVITATINLGHIGNIPDLSAGPSKDLPTIGPLVSKKTATGPVGDDEIPKVPPGDLGAIPEPEPYTLAPALVAGGVLATALGIAAIL